MNVLLNSAHVSVLKEESKIKKNERKKKKKSEREIITSKYKLGAGV